MTPTITTRNRLDTDYQRAVSRMVDRLVFLCLTHEVEYCMEHDDPDAPYHIDDIEGMYPDPSEWTIEQCREYLEGIGCGNHLPDPDDELGTWREEVRAQSEPAEVFEWWAVDKWLWEYLRDRGEVVVEGPTYVWGRCCTGQAISMDSVICEFAESHPDAWWWKQDWT